MGGAIEINQSDGQSSMTIVLWVALGF